MDFSSTQVVRFLEAIQTARENLRPLYNDLILRGARRAPIILSLSGRPVRHFESDKVWEFNGSLILGVGAIQPDGRSMEFTVDLLWTEHNWTIQTEIWLDNDNGQQLIKALPERYAETFDGCLSQLNAGITDLCNCAAVFNTDAI